MIQIKKHQEEWEKLSQEARQAASEQDPRRHQELLERMSAVGGALKKLSQGSVTRTTLSQAVREALTDILKGEREAFFPEIASLRDELAALRGSLEDRTAGGSMGDEGQEGAVGSAADLSRLDGRLQGIEGKLSARLQTIEARIASEIGSADATNGGGLWGLARSLDRRVDSLRSELSQEVEAAASRASAPVEARVEARLAGVEGRVTAELASRTTELASRVTELSSRATEMGARLQGLEEASSSWADEVLRETDRRIEGLSHDVGSCAATADAGINELRGRLGDLSSALESRTAEQLSRATELGSRTTELASLGTELASRVGELSARATELGSRAAEQESRMAEVESATVSRIESLETRLGGSIQSVAARISRELSERIMRVEASLPEIRDLAERLQNQMRSTMVELEEKISGLVEMVNQIQASLPPRQHYDGLDERLVRIESRFRSVSDHLKTIEEALPEVRGLGDQISGVRGEVTSLAGELAGTGKEQRDIWDHFGRRVQDLQDLLRGGLDRWESNRSQVRQRLVDLRDTLRDGLQNAAERVETGPGSFWGKILQRPDGGLRLDNQEWDRFRARLETTLQGLESLLTESKS